MPVASRLADKLVVWTNTLELSHLNGYCALESAVHQSKAVNERAAQQRNGQPINAHSVVMLQISKNARPT